MWNCSFFRKPVPGWVEAEGDNCFLQRAQKLESFLFLCLRQWSRHQHACRCYLRGCLHPGDSPSVSALLESASTFHRLPDLSVRLFKDYASESYESRVKDAYEWLTLAKSDVTRLSECFNLFVLSKFPLETYVSLVSVIQESLALWDLPDSQWDFVASLFYFQVLDFKKKTILRYKCTHVKKTLDKVKWILLWWLF